MMDNAVAAKLNTVNYFVRSIYVATVNGWNAPAPADSTASWDPLTYAIARAHERNLQICAWINPWNNKGTNGAGAELWQHPEWAQVKSGSVTSTVGICFSRVEVRDHVLTNIFLGVADHWTDLDGFHLEEPGLDGTACYCQSCSDFFTANPGASRSTQYAIWCSDFVQRLRSALLTRKPTFLLSCNGSSAAAQVGDKSRGRDWTNWCGQGWMDWYSPQIYTQSATAVSNNVLQTLPLVYGKPLVPGLYAADDLGFQLTGAELKQEILMARALGAMGFSIQRLNELTVPDMSSAIAATSGGSLRVSNLRVGRLKAILP